MSIRPEDEPISLIGAIALGVCAIGVPVAIGMVVLYLVMGA